VPFKKLDAFKTKGKTLNKIKFFIFFSLKETKLYLVALIGLLCIQNSFELTCYTCNEYDNSPNCADQLSGLEASLGLTAACPAGDKCVTFQNPQDGYTWRACSSAVKIYRTIFRFYCKKLQNFFFFLKGLFAIVCS
jgi:hypothetical protein